MPLCGILIECDLNHVGEYSLELSDSKDHVIIQPRSLGFIDPMFNLTALHGSWYF